MTRKLSATTGLSLSIEWRTLFLAVQNVAHALAHVVARLHLLARPPEVPDTAGKWALSGHDPAHKFNARLTAWMSASPSFWR
jgi:hypothetical protein